MVKSAVTASLVSLVLFAAVTPRSLSDTVILRDGTRIDGKVRVRGDSLQITTAENKTVTVKQAEVRRIERMEETEKPKDFRVTDELRRRAEQHRRLQALAAELARGGAGALAAAKELCEAGPDALPFLAAAADQDDAAVVRVALRSLGTIGVRAAADAITQRLPKLKPELQVAALEELVRMRAVQAGPAIAALLRGEKTTVKVKHACVAALGKLRSRLAMPALVAALAKAETAARAAQALIALDSPAALPYLERLIAKKPGTARAAGAIIAKTAGPEHASFLLRLKKSNDIVVREAAASALTRLKASKAARIATYIGLLKSGNEREAANAAARLRKLTKQDAESYEAWSAWWVEENRARARVAVIAVGPVDPSLIRLVRRAVQKATGLRTSAPAKVAPSRWARVPGSKRYRGDALLDQIERRAAQDPYTIAAVAITPARIELPGHGAVIGAFRYGTCGLVSLPGLESGDDADVLKSRVARYALHVLARALRIAKAESATCPAAPIYEPAELDRFDGHFSEKTAESINNSITVSVSVLAGELDGAITALQGLGPVADPRQRAIELGILAERKLDLALARRFWEDAAGQPGPEAEKALLDARIALIDALVKTE